MTQAVLEAREIAKNYGGVAALKGVDFMVHAGAVNVLIGENGAGKSTLMRILAGVERPDAGRLFLDGAPVSFRSVRDAARQGVGMVFQELNLCPNLTVAENIFLTNSPAAGGVVLNRDAEREGATKILAWLGQNISPDAMVSALAIGEQQIVEIARALAEEARVLILDEPTSALSAAEVEALFAVIAELKRNGVAIVYISHRLEELMQIGDHITVLRDGRLQASALAKDVSVDWIVREMLGDDGRTAAPRSARQPGEVILSLRNMTLTGPAGPVVQDVSLDFRSGEVTAVYGLLGAGRTELLEGICGARRARSGVVVFRGEDISHLGIVDRLSRRLQYLPEDRQRDAVIPNISVGGNLTVSALARFTRLGAIFPDKERAAILRIMSRLGVKADSPDSGIGTLSGGNQQKVILGRCLMNDPAAVLLDEPSRGVDIGARAEVFQAMRALADEGLAIVFATSDLSEAMALADRIVVMACGRVTADLPAADATNALLVAAAGRGRAQAAPALLFEETLH